MMHDKQKNREWVAGCWMEPGGYAHLWHSVTLPLLMSVSKERKVTIHL